MAAGHFHTSDTVISELKSPVSSQAELLPQFSICNFPFLPAWGMCVGGEGCRRGSKHGHSFHLEAWAFLSPLHFLTVFVTATWGVCQEEGRRGEGQMQTPARAVPSDPGRGSCWVPSLLSSQSLSGTPDGPGPLPPEGCPAPALHQWVASEKLLLSPAPPEGPKGPLLIPVYQRD